MVRDLVDAAVNLVRTEREDEVFPQAETRADDRLIDLLLPPPPPPSEHAPDGSNSAEESRRRSREKLKGLLQEGKLDEREVEIEVTPQNFPQVDFLQPPQGPEGTDFSFTEWLQQMMPRPKKRRIVRVAEARRILVDEELKRLVDQEDVVNEALDRTENHGIIFVDEIDKIAGERSTSGPDVSREGVQRDLLPIVEGSTVQTRYGYIRTDHILFIAAGAFHVSKPSDLIPELQGRFPIRVELAPLQEKDFVRILTEPENALTRQYAALVAAEGAELHFTPEAIQEIARVARIANERMENIGARRLHTVMATLLDELLFSLPTWPEKRIVFDVPQVRDRLIRVLGDDDLRKYIL
jgi:ATP-dependent HslUV protease ATP-binding subunit HslU